MPKITNIQTQSSNKERLSIYIDGVFCCGIRSRTFQGMGLNIGDTITCDQLKEKESFYWKNAYQGAWKNEKIRIESVKNLITKIDDNIDVLVVGFGADSEEYIKEHPDEKGKPDLNIVNKNKPEISLIRIEVTGTERLRGSGYWVRPDKLEYCSNHPEEDVWIILHYAEPEELFIFIKPDSEKKYNGQTIQIGGAGEIMHVFNDGDEEIKSLDEFSKHLLKKMNS